MKSKKQNIPIGKVAARTGIAVSAIRFYEDAGLITAGRNSNGQRVFAPADIRRISFIIIAQKLGFTLKQIRSQLDNLPDKRTPNKKDWQKISRNFSIGIDERIAALTRLKEKLSSCIGCGCLSLQDCGLYNEDDAAAKTGAGPRFLIED